MPKGGKQHKWRQDIDRVAFYISRYGSSDLPKSQGEVAALLGMSEASLVVGKQNFAGLEGGRGLSHVAKPLIRVHERHKITPKAELRSHVLRVIEAKMAP
jgi:hypothetical protein